VVLSRDPGFRPEGARVARSLDEALAPYGAGQGDVFVIGGAEVFAEALPLARRLVLTRVPGRFGGDARFPPVPADFREVRREALPGPPPCVVLILERQGPPAPRPL
jgi:dihydrofolate reductase